MNPRQSEESTNKKFIQVFIVQSPSLQNPFVKVHAMRILFNPQKQLTSQL